MKYTTHGLLYGPNAQHLDHIAPLCALLDIPLYVTEKKIESLALEYYPSLVVHYLHYEQFAFAYYQQTDAIISCLPFAILQEIFFLPSQLIQKKWINVWCPHGNSEKGYNDYFSEALAKEKIILSYGKKVEKQLHQASTADSSPHIITVGNYRLLFFEKIQLFYQKLLEKKIFRFLDKNKKNVLFAPSWHVKETFDEYEKIIHTLADSIGEQANLLIKLHPNTVEKYPLELDLLKQQFQDHPSIFFIHDIPTIYPILNEIDLYLGNHSSIVFDYLYFKKPILLLDHAFSFLPSLSLQNIKTLKTTLLQLLHHPEMEWNRMQEQYQSAFAENISSEILKTNIFDAIKDELHNG